jgi:peptide deformylase
MSILPITLYGDKILRKKVKEVNDIDLETIELIKNMFDTMRNASGIGLAANQVGVDKSIFVIDISVVEGYEKSKPMVLINPVITERSEKKITMEEGCLSIPGIRSEVLRPEAATITFHDTNMQEQTIKADKLLARVIQHEYDHLQGILFTDLLSDETKKEFKKDLNKVRRGKMEVDYPVCESVSK